MIATPAIVVVVLVLALAGDGDGDEGAPPAGVRASAAGPADTRVDRFDSGRAWRLLRDQVELGPRPAGSEPLRRLAGILRARLPRGRFEAVPGHPGLRNVVGRLPGRRPAVVVAAHYDTKDLPGFVGANDGAGGTAAVLEIARALRRMNRPRGAPEIRFVLFDGEEATDDRRFYETGVRGSKAYAARHGDDVRALVLLDFVAEKGAMRIPREAGSHPGLWRRLRQAARRVGAGQAFPPGTVGEVTDDHTPFTRRGIPAIDLIDFTFPCWHKPCDDLSAVSERSLDLSGEAVVELLRTWR
jgi:acetylornithine deacetylase/succinyl-diaminopimelate desuccinylase-like protein